MPAKGDGSNNFVDITQHNINGSSNQIYNDDFHNHVNEDKH